MPCFLNPATLLPNPEKDSPLHDCSEILAEMTAIRKDLIDVPLNNSELIWFTDGSSFIKDGQRKAGAAIVDDSGKIIWAEALPLGTSTQKVETKTGRMDTKTRPLYMLLTRDPPQNKGHIQTESERLEKDIPRKERPKESRSGNTHIR